RGAAAATVATDVYGLGATLYHVLAGRPPFPTSSLSTVFEQILHETPPPPSAWWAACDRDLETICLKCLDKEPRKRYASAKDLADDLRRWLNHEPIKARRAGAVERARKWARRHPLRVARAALAMCSVLACLLGSLLYVNHLGRE